MMGFGLILPLLLIAFIAYALGGRPQQVWSQSPAQSTEQTPLDILKTRYAHGEINREEYEAMRGDLLAQSYTVRY